MSTLDERTEGLGGMSLDSPSAAARPRPVAASPGSSASAGPASPHDVGLDGFEGLPDLDVPPLRVVVLLCGTIGDVMPFSSARRASLLSPFVATSFSCAAASITRFTRMCSSMADRSYDWPSAHTTGSCITASVCHDKIPEGAISRF